MTDEMSRREFLRLLGRVGAGAALGVLGFRLLRRGRKPAREECVNDGVCRGCPTFQACGLPAALSARERAPWARSTP
ncbi:MAG TPA: hypothetical protein VMF68_09120 [Spirochaetia bacterium]|nr:hypothetical protein [Spirochaetia bacterium]